MISTSSPTFTSVALISVVQWTFFRICDVAGNAKHKRPISAIRNRLFISVNGGFITNPFWPAIVLGGESPSYVYFDLATKQVINGFTLSDQLGLTVDHHYFGRA